MALKLYCALFSLFIFVFPLHTQSLYHCSQEWDFSMRSKCANTTALHSLDIDDDGKEEIMLFSYNEDGYYWQVLKYFPELQDYWPIHTQREDRIISTAVFDVAEDGDQEILIYTGVRELLIYDAQSFALKKN